MPRKSLGGKECANQVRTFGDGEILVSPDRKQHTVNTRVASADGAVAVQLRRIKNVKFQTDSTERKRTEVAGLPWQVNFTELHMQDPEKEVDCSSSFFCSVLILQLYRRKGKRKSFVKSA
jgi:hypothetical protein